MTNAATNTNEAKKTGTEVTKAGLSALAFPMEDFLADAGAGLEEVGSEDIAVPYISIVQKQSKVMDDKAFNGKPGMFIHTITKDLYDGQAGIDVIPCHFRRFWREITEDPKDPKFIDEHPANWSVAKGATFDGELRRHICHDGTHANQIMRFYCLMVSPCETTQPVCLTFKGSQIRKAKNWNSMLSVMTMEVEANGKKQKVQAPTFMSLWNLKTVMESFDDKTWHGYELTSRGMLDPINVQIDAEVYLQARDFHAMVASGNAVEVGDYE